MLMNGILLLVTRSQDIKLITTEFLPSRTAKQPSSSVTKLVKVYAIGGFIVRLVMMDMVFEKNKDKFDRVEVK